MNWTRRQVLAGCAQAVPALAWLSTPVVAWSPAVAWSPDHATTGVAAPEPSSLGIVIHSYTIRRFTDPLLFLDYCHELGAAGVQIPIGVRDEAYAAKLRQQLENKRMYLEGSIRLPRDRADLERFTSEVRSAKQCGATVLRTVMLAGRRYETFRTAEDFRGFADSSWQSLLLAKPIIEQQEMRLAIENHKDWRTEELLDLLRRAGSAHIGVCVDIGNSIALLEDPLAVVEAYAPWALSTHIKDMGVEEYPEGFLLAEVPLGSGFLDLPRILATLRRARPEAHFNLEMLTRDPLKIPCLTDQYYATLANLPCRHLAETLRLVRAHAAKQPLPRVSGLSREERLAREDDNVRRSLRYAREHLGL
jgi:sugar phosphate isomerase/epimerase